MSRTKTQRLEFGNDFDVTGDWLEFSGKKPARRSGIRELVYLVIDGYEFDPTDLHDLSTTIDIEGRRIEPIVRVFDSNGHVFQTKDTTRIGRVIGLAILKRPDGTRLTAEADNVRIAIRSDEKFRCKQSVWTLAV